MPPGPRRHRGGLGLRWWPVLVPLVVVLVGAWHYRWVDEDAFIDFRVVHNVLAGHGPVFNVGERVEVDSDPLWLASLLLGHAATPFLRIEWLSVVLGMLCTAGGFLAGGRAVQRLVGPREARPTVLPAGLLIVAVTAGVWEFATSGLEMSMVFLWLGVSFLLLVRVLERGRGGAGSAVVVGLGVLIRPELLLQSLALLAALVWVSSGADRRAGRPVLGRAVGRLAAAAGLPVLVELLRMGYYALLVPNTGLAKAGAAAWWTQGATYLWNLVSPYTLWVPLLLAVPLLVGPAGRWWRRGDRGATVVLLAPVAAGLLDVLYVVRLGGDYMHARLLLPGLFAACLPVAVPVGRPRAAGASSGPEAPEAPGDGQVNERARELPARARWAGGPALLSLVGIAVWAVVCAGWLRYVPPPVTSLNPQTVFISNERNSWIQATGRQNPVTAGDYSAALSGRAGGALSRLAARVPRDDQQMLVITNPYAPLAAARLEPARSRLPFRLAVDVPAIGVIGYLAGPKVYLFDSYSLANPIGSHTTVEHHARPGHEKYVPTSWMVGRFGAVGASGANGVAGTSSRVISGSSGTSLLAPSERPAVAAARRALGCAPLSSYLRAITAPMTPGRFLDDLGEAVGFTTFSFSANPLRAASELCGGSALAARPTAG